jgi:hypothetical protein
MDADSSPSSRQTDRHNARDFFRNDNRRERIAPMRRCRWGEKK